MTHIHERLLCIISQLDGSRFSEMKEVEAQNATILG